MIIALAAAQVNIGAICVSIVLYDMGQQLCQVSSVSDSGDRPEG